MSSLQTPFEHPLEAGLALSGLETSAHYPASVLFFDARKRVALAPHSAMELVEQPEIMTVPGCSYYALGLMKWQGQHLAVLDLASLLNAYAKPSRSRARHALVVAYQSAPGQPLEYGALACVELPQTLQVSDDKQCPMPSDSDLWPLIASSCFSDANGPVPILNLSRVFGGFLG